MHFSPVISLASRTLSKYNYCAKEYAFLTNAITGFVIAAVGDAFCQQYFDSDKRDRDGKTLNVPQWNVGRSLELGVVRTAVITPFIHFWYPFLERVCPGATVLRLAGRVLIDQGIGAPITISMVFVANSALKGDIAGGVHRIKQQFVSVYTTGLRYWPLVHSINFSVVPMTHRSLFAHLASVYWMAVLSHYSNMEYKSSVSVQQEEDNDFR